MAAWSFLLQGQKDEAVQNMDRAFKNFGNIFGRKKEKLDVLINRIFFLTFGGEKNTAGGLPVQEKKEDGKADGLAALLGKVFGGSKRKDQGSNPAGTNEASREMNKAVRDLAVTVEQLSQGNPVQGEDPGLIATEEFFYRERYTKFAEFLLALYGKGNEAGEEALKAMEESPRCRLCNQASCMRLVIARALLLEQQDKRQEAGQLYRELLKNQPYNLYAKAKLREL